MTWPVSHDSSLLRIFDDENPFQPSGLTAAVRNKQMRVRVAHSPDPDDAFMFFALTAGLVETSGREYEHVLADIDTLNRHSLVGTYEVSAVSIHSYPQISDDYYLMNCGASMGEGYGPILISNVPLTLQQAKQKIIAVPGVSTSAYLTLRLALGEVEVHEVPFDQILPRVVSGEFDAGVIIHEGQLTWQTEGANLVIDLGVWWKEATGLPLPLGGNVVRKDLGGVVCRQIAKDVSSSIKHALENPKMALEFSRQWGRGIDDDTNEEFVRMYVNERTLDYREDGRAAVRLFLKRGQEIGLVRGDFDVEDLVFLGEVLDGGH